MSALPLRILVVVEDGLDPIRIEAALPATARVTRARLAHAENALGVLRDSAADAELVLVGCARQRQEALETIERVAHGDEPRPVVVLYDGTPNGFMERAFVAGADDLITLQQPQPELAFALEKAIARRRRVERGRREGEVITVLGPKGGTGKTLTACNIAVALAQAGSNPLVVDLDLQFGDVGLAFGMRPERTIYDLAVSGGSLDGEKIDSFAVRHESGASALLAPTRPDQAAAVSVELIRDVLELSRVRHDFTIVDTPPSFGAEVIAAIDGSSRLCVVGMLDALSLKNTKIGLETLAQMGYDPADVTLVLNRADTSIGISHADVERVLGRAPDVLIPSDRAIPRVITEGRTVVEAEPRSGAARAYAALASQYLAASGAPAKPAEPAAKRRKSMLAIGGR